MRPGSLLSTFLLAGILLLPAQSLAQHDAGGDLDALSPQLLEAALNDELDDVYESLDPDEYYSVDAITNAVMGALSDDGDTGNEDIMSFADLEDEMNEAGTTVQDEVAAAVEEADNYAALAAPGIHAVASRNLQLAGDDQVMTRAAFGSVKRRLANGIRRSR